MRGGSARPAPRPDRPAEPAGHAVTPTSCRSRRSSSPLDPAIMTPRPGSSCAPRHVVRGQRPRVSEYEVPDRPGPRLAVPIEWRGVGATEAATTEAPVVGRPQSAQHRRTRAAPRVATPQLPGGPGAAEGGRAPSNEAAPARPRGVRDSPRARTARPGAPNRRHRARRPPSRKFPRAATDSPVARSEGAGRRWQRAGRQPRAAGNSARTRDRAGDRVLAARSTRPRPAVDVSASSIRAPASAIPERRSPEPGGRRHLASSTSRSVTSVSTAAAVVSGGAGKAPQGRAPAGLDDLLAVAVTARLDVGRPDVQDATGGHPAPTSTRSVAARRGARPARARRRTSSRRNRPAPPGLPGSQSTEPPRL